ncbi:MAG: hypothetical protein ACD_32C00051G0002, partial [uncultured bacterium]
MENQKTTHTGPPATPSPIMPNPIDNLPKPAYPSPRFMSKRMAMIFLAIVVAGIFGFLIAGFIIISKNSEKPKTYSVIPTHAPDPTADWTPYTYKNLMFKHPKDWAVIFKSDVENKPDDFSLRLQQKDATGIQPDEIRISTFNDRADLPEELQYNIMPLKKFDKTGDEDEDYIQFKIGGITVYSACIF